MKLCVKKYVSNLNIVQTESVVDIVPVTVFPNLFVKYLVVKYLVNCNIFF